MECVEIPGSVPLPLLRSAAACAHGLGTSLSEDCFLGARLLQQQNCTDLPKQLISPACQLATDDEDCRKLATELRI